MKKPFIIAANNDNSFFEESILNNSAGARASRRSVASADISKSNLQSQNKAD